MAALVAAITVLLRKLTPGWVGEEGAPKPGYIFVNLGYSFLAAAAGGYVTAWIAVHNPLIHVLALAIIVLLLAALSVLQQRGDATRVVHARAGRAYTLGRIGGRPRPAARTRYPLIFLPNAANERSRPVAFLSTGRPCAEQSAVFRNRSRTAPRP